MTRLRLLGACGLVVAGCTTGLAVRGEARGPVFDLTAEGKLATGASQVTLRFDNHGQDPVAVELAEVRLRDPRGGRSEPVGRPQAFVEGGVRVTRRVPQRTLNVPPGEKRQVVLDFVAVPPPGSGYSIVVPTILRLTIEGQIELKPLRVALRDAREAAPVPDGGFYDPFEQ